MRKAAVRLVRTPRSVTQSGSSANTGAPVSIDVIVFGSDTPELEGLLRGAGIRAMSAPEKDLLRLVQPGVPSPTVVVLDVRRQGALPAALPLLKKEHPGTGVVIVAGK